MGMIKKAVIPAAGLGTRLLPITKEMPKEMLPVFVRDRNGEISLKPFLQIIFEELYRVGFREFCLIVGRGKRAIEDHFTPDSHFVEYLRMRGKGVEAYKLEEFYEMILESDIFFVNQPEPKGFGDSLLHARNFTTQTPFLLHAGDDLIQSPGEKHLKKMEEVFTRLDADALFFVEEMEDPRRYGVVVGSRVDEDLVHVENIYEKPEKPPTNLATVAVYMFKPVIYEYIERVTPDESGEIQLTEAIRMLAEERGKVYALRLKPGERRIDIGVPENYLSILQDLL